MNLHSASNNWRSRPMDERFWSLDELLQATKAHRDHAAIGHVANDKMRVELSSFGDDDSNSEIILLGAEQRAQLSRWAFSQLCRKIGAPADHYRDLLPTLAVNSLNWLLKNRIDNKDGQSDLLIDTKGKWIIRAINTPAYKRVWNHTIVEKLLPLPTYGWRVPPAYSTAGDPPYELLLKPNPDYNDTPIGLTDAQQAERDAYIAKHKLRQVTPDMTGPGTPMIEVGQWVTPAGLYAGFEDMFVFMIDDSARINDGTDEGLSRGFFISNSEVGKASLKITTFMFRYVCGNHIVWGASDTTRIKLRHIGKDIDGRWNEALQVAITEYANESASDVESKIKSAQRFTLGSSVDEVVDKIFQLKLLTRASAQAAYDAVKPDVDGDPFTAWAMAQGVTRLSQGEANIDKRTALDAAASKIIELAF